MAPSRRRRRRHGFGTLELLILLALVGGAGGVAALYARHVGAASRRSGEALPVLAGPVRPGVGSVPDAPAVAHAVTPVAVSVESGAGAVPAPPDEPTFLQRIGDWLFAVHPTDDDVYANNFVESLAMTAVGAGGVGWKALTFAANGALDVTLAPVPQGLPRFQGTPDRPGLILGTDLASISDEWPKMSTDRRTFTLVVHGTRDGRYKAIGSDGRPVQLTSEHLEQEIRKTGLWRKGMTLRMITCLAGACRNVGEVERLGKRLGASAVEAFSGDFILREGEGIVVNHPRLTLRQFVILGRWVRKAL